MGTASDFNSNLRAALGGGGEVCLRCRLKREIITVDILSRDVGVTERERVRGGGAADLPGIVVDPNLPSCFYGTRVTWSFICTHEK